MLAPLKQLAPSTHARDDAWEHELTGGEREEPPTGVWDGKRMMRRGVPRGESSMWMEEGGLGGIANARRGEGVDGQVPSRLRAPATGPRRATGGLGGTNPIHDLD